MLLRTHNAPKLCVEIGKFGLLSFKTPIGQSPLVRLADAFEIKAPPYLAQVHALRTGTASEHNAEQQRLAEILATGKELTYHGSGILDEGFAKGFVASGHVAMLTPAGITYTSFSLGQKRNKDEQRLEQPLAHQELLMRSAARLETLRTGFQGQLGFENEPYHQGGIDEYVADPVYISEFFRSYPDFTFLLDLSHARVAANAMGIDVVEYLRGLPLDRVDHIHLSHPTWSTLPGAKGPVMFDAHEAPQDEDFAYLDLALSLTARPSYLTIEYFRDEETMIASYQRLRDFFQPTIKVPLSRNFTLLNFSLAAATERFAALAHYDRGKIASIAREHTKAKQEAIFRELLELESKRGLFADTPENVATHTANIYTAYVQATTASYEELAAAADPQQLERLCLCPDRGRVENNLSRLKASLERYAPFLWQTLIFRHDDGKVISAPLHEQETGKLLKKFRLLDKPAYARLAAAEKALLSEIMEHHTNLGCTYLGDNSLLIFQEVFNCPAMRELLAGPDGKIDLATAGMLLEMWAAFTCLDACGLGAKGILSNSRVEYYYRMASQLYASLERNSADYDGAVAEIETIARGEFLTRLCGMLASYDLQGDSKIGPWQENNSHLSFYTKNIEAALARLTGRGEISAADWSGLRESFHKIVQLPYPVSFYSIAWSNPEVERTSPQPDAKLYDGFLKYLMLLNRAAEGCSEIGVIKGEGGGLMRSATDLDPYLPKIRAAIDRARGLVTEGKLTYFADADGRKIEDSPFMYKKGTALIVDLSPTAPDIK